MVEFARLRTVTGVHEPLKPVAHMLYRALFNNCRIQELRNCADGYQRVHILDRDFGIDSLIHMKSGQYITLQEKYREFSKWPYQDFTMETVNGDGSPGEFYHLCANLYSYAWGDQECKHFVQWMILDILKFKMLVEKNGGILNTGKPYSNDKHGKAKFQAIPLEFIKPSILYIGTGRLAMRRINSVSFSEPYVLDFSRKPE